MGQFVGDADRGGINSMIKRLSALQREPLLLLACSFSALALGAIPGLRVAGMPMWFFLAPTLVAAYCCSLRLFLIGGMALLVLAFPIMGDSPDTFYPVALTSYALCGLVNWIRSVTRIRETLLIATGALVLVAYPLLALIYAYAVNLEGMHAMLLASRYVVESLLSIVLAEVVIFSATLTDWRGLALVRAALGFRPSLTQIAELITSVAVTLSLVMSLIMFWRSWEADINDDMKLAAAVAIESRLSAAAGSIDDRMRVASVFVAEASDSDESKRATFEQLRSLLSLPDTSSPGLPSNAAMAIYRDGEIFVDGDWSLIDARRAMSLADDAFSVAESQVVAIQLDFEGGVSRPVTIYRRGDGLMLLICFADDESAELFEFDRVIAREAQQPLVRLVAGAREPANTRAWFAVPDDAEVVESTSEMVVWRDESPSGVRAGTSVLASLTPGLTAVYRPRGSQIERYQPVLHGVDRYRAELNIWRYFIDFARTVTVSTLIDIAILAALLLLARLVVGRLVQPLAELTRVFESWRQFRGGELGSGAALQAMDSTGLSALRDIHSLQQGFRALAQDVMYGERRLSTIAANYDELLRSLPLGVLAVDGTSRVQFLNDALGEMTGQRQDALQRLKGKAAQMLANGTRVEEWQLAVDDAPPKSLLLVVNHRLDERGQESGLWVIVTDLTEQKQTSAQLVQASKLATLGEMSTGMAHELNQPLNVISLATSNLRFTIKKGKATPENTLSKLDRIDGAVHRAANIIDHMRAYGRLAGEGLTEINLGEVVAGACNLLAEQLKLANIALVNQVPEEGLTIKGNAIQLEQVLINLVNNAKDAIKEGGNAGTITVDSEISDTRVRVRVTDTGGGIPSHVLPHIFEPFFTTKPVGKGTGLGGSISYGIVREMQGDIWAENVDNGAQITISLPLVEFPQPALAGVT